MSNSIKMRAHSASLTEAAARGGHVGAHDHGACVHDALHRAENAFGHKGMKLTPLRRRVFEEIAGSHDAVGAYDVLDRLARKTGERLAPVSVYRAIDALLEAGVVHRLESRNAFFACHAPTGLQHIALVCEDCGTVSEIDGATLHQVVGQAARGAGFIMTAAVIEITGRCGPCIAKPAGE